MPMRLALFLLVAGLGYGCQPSNPPPTPLPTKEKTLDRVQGQLDQAQKQALERIEQAEPKSPPGKDPMKEGY